MSLIRYYLDDDSASIAVARGLDAAGVTVLSADSAGMRGRSDAEHLEFSASEGLALVTANRRDFVQLHWQYVAENRFHAGVVIMSQQTYSVGERIRRLLRLREHLSAEEMQSSLEFLSRWGDS